MSENFKRLKRRTLQVAVVKSVFAALAGGALCSGIALLLTTHGIINTNPMLSSLIAGISALLLSGIVTFLILNKSNEALARRLDTSFSLSERVQTMLEYADSNDTVSALQREDTENALAAIPSSKIKFKRLWIYVLALAVGIAMLVTSGLLIPPKVQPTPKPPTPFSITPIQVRAMEELIEYVEEPYMESPYREEVAQALTDALAELKLATTVDECTEVINRANEKIISATDDSSPVVETVDALVKLNSSAKKLGFAINHFDYKRGGEADSFSKGMSELRDSFRHSDEDSDSPDGAKMAKETRELLLATAADITYALTSSEASDADVLYTALLKFASQSGDAGVHGLASLALQEDMSYDELQAALDTTFNAMNAEIFRAIDIKSANTSVGEYAVRRMCETFGVKTPEFERPKAQNNADDSGDGSNDSGSGSGAIGEGTVYGSDELVLDPFTGEYVEYGTIITRYYQIMFNKTQGDLYTEEEKEALAKYFDILYSGFEDKE